MWISFTILGGLLLLITGFLVKEHLESRHISAELKAQFAKLVASDIQPQSDWPKWACKAYATWYREYRSVLNWCDHRLQSLVCSRYTVAVLEEKFRFLHTEQQKLRYLLQEIDKYDKVPFMKTEAQKRLESLYEKMGQISETSPLYFQYMNMEDRLNAMDTSNRDNYPDIYRSLDSCHWFMDILEENLNKEKALRVA